MERRGRAEEEVMEESVRLMRRSGTGGGETRWVDGSEVDSESPPWSVFEDDECGDGYGSIRRRLVKKPKRIDSFDVEAMEIAGSHKHDSKEELVTCFLLAFDLCGIVIVLSSSFAEKSDSGRNMDLSGWQTLALAFQTLGVVYGDMGTSPLYVFADVFSKVSIETEVDILGALSLVMYTIALLPLAKYVFIVLKANDNGEGGTFALYSLICRYAKVNMLPNRQPADEQISSFRLKLPTPELERALNIKEKLETKSSLKTLLLLLVLMGTSLIIGDGILTPAMSVMSAVSGLQGEIHGFGTNAVVLVSIVILVALFSIQRFGTGKVGFIFAPVLSLWFFCLGSIGIYNVVKYDISVLKAFNPVYIYYFFSKNSSNAWSSLGGCVLCITGKLPSNLSNSSEFYSLLPFSLCYPAPSVLLDRILGLGIHMVPLSVTIVSYIIHLFSPVVKAVSHRPFFIKSMNQNHFDHFVGTLALLAGAEAMFADLGHFTVKSIQIAFTCMVFPCLLLAYMGQAAYMMKHPGSAGRIFYDSVPCECQKLSPINDLFILVLVY
ncbi:Potassium transporter [Dillenia turbinata]|uniref:Potassium transporter n=1 Tax=Dillenia turbinata TaxID=194707 RepID=A0AAN8V2L0_9MAGN